VARYLEISLEKRDVHCVARLLDEKAPRTCEAVWNALPLGGQAYHAKYARNEIYALVPSFADPEPGPEHTTITPIPGDLVYFGFESWQLSPATHGYQDEELFAASRPVDLAVFYGRNNLLLNPDFGFVPGNVFGSIEEGLDELAAAAQDLWLSGAAGEVLSFRRLERSS
jgi:hypothetical protein